MCIFFTVGIHFAATFGSPFYFEAGPGTRPEPENHKMQKTDTKPIWVYLAFSGIATRKGALLLIAACAVFSLYCIPWPVLFPDREWIMQLFLVDDWSWFATMVPITAWYGLSLRWVDTHSGWPDRIPQQRMP